MSLVTMRVVRHRGPYTVLLEGESLAGANLAIVTDLWVEWQSGLMRCW